MTHLRWGILATGGIARKFAADLVLTGRPIAAVGSRSQATADAFVASLGLTARAHGSYEALVADPDVDAVYIATPHPGHAPAAEMAIRAGKHVLIEKPFTMTAAEAQRLLDLAAAHRVALLEAMWARFLPHMVRLREVLKAGTIGDVRVLVATHTQDLPDDPAHRLNALILGGGALLDLGIYPVSFAYNLFGAPATIQASGRMKATGADAEVSIILRYPGGETALLVAASDVPGTNRAEICGTEGYIEIDTVWYQPTTFRVYDSKRTLLETFDGAVEGRGMQFQAAELERLVEVGELSSPILPVAESVAIMAVLDEVRRQVGIVYPGD